MRTESDTRSRRGCGDAAWVAALWIAAALFFRGALFQEMSLYLRDVIVFYFPQAHLIAQALRAGRLPGWEPAIGLGYPFHADPHSLIAYPLAWLLALPQPRSFNVFLVIHVPIAGTTFYALLRRWCLSAPAAALGAAALMFSGYFANLTCHALMLRGLAWLPLVLLAFDRFLESGSRRALAATTLALALEGAATDPQCVLFTIALLFLMPWLRPSPTSLRFGRVATSVLAAAAGASAMLAIQYLPLAQLVLQSTRGAGMEHAEKTHYQLDIRQLTNLVVPLSFPNPADPDFSASYPGNRFPFLSDIFWGIPLLALAAAAIGWVTSRDGPPEWRPGRTAIVAAALAAAGLLLSFGDRLPFYAILTTVVPILDLFRSPAKYFFFTGLAIPLLASLGFEGLLRARPHGDAAVRIALLAGIALLAVAGVALEVFGSGLAAAYLAPEQGAAGAVELDTVARLRDSWTAALSPALLATSMALFLAALLGVRPARRPELCALLGSMTVLYLAASTSGTAALAPDAFLAGPPRTAMLLTRLGAGMPPPRFVTHPPTGPLPLAHRTTAYLRFALGRELMTQTRGIPHGCNPLIASWAFDIRAKAWLDGQLRGGDILAADRVAAACGAAFSLRVGDDPAFAQGPDRLLGRVGLTGIWQLAGPAPRVFVATSYRRARPGEELPSLDALQALDREAIVAGDAPLSPAADDRAPPVVRECRFTRYDAGAIDVRFDVSKRALLVLLELPYPGWRAAVDGRERPIVAVAGLFRGVEVEAGEHLLEMRYVPVPFRVGAAVSLASVLVALGFVVMGGPPPPDPPGGKARRSGRRLHGSSEA